MTPTATLTPRQSEAVRMAAEHGNQEAARRLNVRPQTLKSHLASAYSALGVFTIAAAAAALVGIPAPAADDPVAAVRGKPRNRDVKAPKCTYACAHCAYRTDRVTHAWAHGMLHGYRVGMVQ